MGVPEDLGQSKADEHRRFWSTHAENLWIRQRLEDLLGEARGMEGHARRLLVSGELSDRVTGEHRVWVVRAGQDGEFEAAALKHNLAILGFEKVGDLASSGSRAAVTEKVRPAYPSAKARQVSQWAGYLQRFRLELRLGDRILMPRKAGPPNTVAVGRVAGPYTFREVDGNMRHTRPVTWERNDVPRERFGGRSTKALKARGTIARVKENDAAAGIDRILGGPAPPAPGPPLVPLPAAQRRKGLTAVRGLFDRMLALVDFAREHPAYEDILEYVRTEDPDKKEASIKAQFHRVASEFDTMRRIGDQVQLTERGRQLFESRDPDALRDHLLTKVLGIDHALVKLAAGPVDGGALFTFLQGVNPGWTTTFIPVAEVRWLVSLGVVQRQDRTFVLTDRGQRWRNAIHWKPERLRDEPIPPIPVPADISISVPTTADVVSRIAKAASDRGLVFEPKLIEALHLGLWANEDRHFAVLAGLSGSGKTQLAMEYASALTGELSDKVLDRAFTLEFWDIAVDAWPKWSDTTLPNGEKDRVRKLLNDLMKALRPARLHFGWRVIAEFVAFLERRAADSAEITFDEALDQITYAKVLPKLRGDDAPRFRNALTACREALDGAGLTDSQRKVGELLEDLDETGSFRFWR